MSERERKIDEFLAITGASREIADSLLNVCNDNLEMAINMHMEGVQTEEVGAQNQPGTSSAVLPAIDEGKSIKIYYLLDRKEKFSQNSVKIQSKCSQNTFKM